MKGVSVTVANTASIVSSIARIVDSKLTTDREIYRINVKTDIACQVIQNEGKKKIMQIDYLTKYGTAILNSKNCSSKEKKEAFIYTINQLSEIN